MEQSQEDGEGMELDTEGWSRYGTSQVDVVGMEQDTGGLSRLELDRLEQARRLE